MRTPTSKFALGLSLFSFVSVLAAGACAEQPAAAGPAPETEEAKTLYALGLAVAQNLGTLGLSAEELDWVQRGLADSVLGRDLAVDLAEYGPKLQSFAQGRLTAATEKEKSAGADYLTGAAGEESAVQTDSGLIITEIEPGTGESPSAEDTVRVHYHGTLRDGTVFDSSVDRGEPVSFPLNRVIPCWTEGLQRMKVGGKSRLVCPSAIAYGDEGRPPAIPGGAVLIFDVELLGIEGDASPAE